jgi:hypothetical protein
MTAGVDAVFRNLMTSQSHASYVAVVVKFLENNDANRSIQ